MVASIGLHSYEGSTFSGEKLGRYWVRYFTTEGNIPLGLPPANLSSPKQKLLAKVLPLFSI